MFPQYLPNRFAHRYARTFISLAARRATRVLTVSESSKARHPAVRRRAAGEDRRHLQRVRRAVRRRAERGRRRARARALSARRRVRALRRQREAAQEPRAADPGVSARAQPRPRQPQARADRRRHLAVRRAAARRPPASAAQARALPRLPPRGDARRHVPARQRVRVPLALRRLRAAAARGDGQRHAGRHLERLVAAGSDRRRRRARGSVRSGGDRRRHLPRADRRGSAAGPAAEGAGAGAPVLVGAVGAPRARDLPGEVA